MLIFIRLRQSAVGSDAVCRLLLIGQFEAAVDLCVTAGDLAAAFSVALAGGSELVAKVSRAYNSGAGRRLPHAGLLRVLQGGQWSALVAQTHPERWRDTLALLLT